MFIKPQIMGSKMNRHLPTGGEPNLRPPIGGGGGPGGPGGGGGGIAISIF